MLSTKIAEMATNHAAALIDRPNARPEQISIALEWARTASFYALAESLSMIEQHLAKLADAPKDLHAIARNLDAMTDRP